MGPGALLPNTPAVWLSSPRYRSSRKHTVLSAKDYKELWASTRDHAGALAYTQHSSKSSKRILIGKLLAYHVQRLVFYHPCHNTKLGCARWQSCTQGGCVKGDLQLKATQ